MGVTPGTGTGSRIDHFERLGVFAALHADAGPDQGLGSGQYIFGNVTYPNPFTGKEITVSAPVGEKWDLDGTKSYDKSGTIVSYKWSNIIYGDHDPKKEYFDRPDSATTTFIADCFWPFPLQNYWLIELEVKNDSGHTAKTHVRLFRSGTLGSHTGPR